MFDLKRLFVNNKKKTFQMRANDAVGGAIAAVIRRDHPLCGVYIPPIVVVPVVLV